MNDSTNLFRKYFHDGAVDLRFLYHFLLDKKQQMEQGWVFSTPNELCDICNDLQQVTQMLKEGK